MTPRRAPWTGLFARLVLKDVSLHISLALMAGLALFVAVDFVETGNLSELDSSAADVLQLELYNLPLVFQQIAAICVVVGTLTALGALLRRGELVAMFAAGASPFALLRPALIVGFVVASVHASVTEWIAPIARAEVASSRRKLGLPSRGPEVLSRGNLWFKGADRIYRVQDLEDSAGRALGGVLMLRIEGGRLLERWDVERLSFDGAAWTAENVVWHRFEDGGSEISTQRMERTAVLLSETPEDFVRSVGAPDGLGFVALLDATRARERLGQPAVEHQLELHRRIAYPILLFLAVTLGAALALRLGRRPTLAGALGAGAAIGFSLWLLDEVTVALATTSALAPSIAAHAAPAVLLGANLVAWWTALRRGIRAT